MTNSIIEPDSITKTKDKQDAIAWAQTLIQRVDWVLLDTETTGTYEDDEVLQVSIVGHDGAILLNQLVKPKTKRSWPGAQAVHGITPDMVADAPQLDNAWSTIADVIANKIIIAYNADFDKRLLQQSGADTGKHTFDCAMRQYSKFVGEWAEWKGEYKWQKLPRVSKGNHDAAEDCILTLKAIQAMASGTDPRDNGSI